MSVLSDRHVSEARNGDPTLTLFSGDRAKTLAGLDAIPRRIGSSSLLWVDVQCPTDELARRVVEALDLDDQVAAALASHGDSAAFRDAGRFVHVTVQTPEAESGDALNEVECVVGQNWVLTAHEQPVSVLDEFATLAEGSGTTGDLDGPSFLAALLQWVLNEYSMAFERLEDELETLDERAMRGHGSADAHINALVELRRRTGRLRRSLNTHRAPLLALTHPELKALGDKASARRFQDLLERYEATLQAARDARASVVSSFDVLIARTGHRTNEVMKILTLASVILLPGSLLAGVMGMNFKVSVFEHVVGFWIVVAVIVAIGVVTLTTAKLRRWI